MKPYKPTEQQVELMQKIEREHNLFCARQNGCINCVNYDINPRNCAVLHAIQYLEELKINDKMIKKIEE